MTQTRETSVETKREAARLLGELKQAKSAKDSQVIVRKLEELLRGQTTTKT